MGYSSSAGYGQEALGRMSVKVPNTYSEWATVLDMLKNKENDEIPGDL